MLHVCLSVTYLSDIVRWSTRRFHIWDLEVPKSLCILGSLITCIAFSLKNCPKLHWLILSPTTVTCNSWVLQKVWRAVFIKTVAMMNSAQCWHLDSGKRHCFPNAWISAFQLFHVFFQVFPCFSRFRNLQRNGFLPEVARSQRSFPAQQAETSTDLLHRGVTRTHRPALQVYHKAENEWRWMKMNENESCSEKFWPGSYDKLLISYW